MFFLPGKYHRTGETELRERRWGPFRESNREYIVKVDIKKGYKNIGSMNLFIYSRNCVFTYQEIITKYFYVSRCVLDISIFIFSVYLALASIYI